MIDSYSTADKLLHSLCLSSTQIKRLFFEVERTLFRDETASQFGQHVFVCGLARSGTTALLEAIYSSGKFASLTYQDMPFVLAPNFWAKLRISPQKSEPKERSHRDGMTVNIGSPEAFEEVFWQAIGERGNNEQYQDYISLILKRYNRSRYLSKSNQNLNRLGRIGSIFPKANLLLTFRDPLCQAESLFTQHQRFSSLQMSLPFTKTYMNLIHHHEFGIGYRPNFSESIHFKDPNTIDHWLEQWFLTYEKAHRQYSKNRQVSFICYEGLCSSSVVWNSLQDKLQISQKYEFKPGRSGQTKQKKINPELKMRCYDLYRDMRNNF